MEEEILQLYEKVQDELSQDEFLAEMDQIRKNNIGVDFMNEIDFAREVLKNHGVDDFDGISEDESSEDVPFEIQYDDNQEVVDEDETTFTMTEDVLERYNKVKNQISQEDFLQRMADFKKQESANPFMNDSGFADMVVGELITEEVEAISEKPEFAVNTIDKLENGRRDTNVEGRVISISNKRSFKTRKGRSGEVCNVELQDNTGSIRAVFWTQNMPLLKKIEEGDIIQIKGVDIKEGYSGLEANLRQRSTIIKLDEDPSKFPVYEEVITNIADIQPETKVNIIARIVRIPTVRKYEKNGKEGQVASIELQDATGKISYTLWNKNVELIEELGLEDGDTVKILSAQSRERINRDGDSEISLSHWDGRIIKGDYDVPDIVQEFSEIGDLREQKDVSIKGVVVRLQDIKTFVRKSDNTEGRLRNFDVEDASGFIRVTVWGDDTDLPINKGDIVKIIGGDVRFDEYTQTGYSMNTNFNTQITINPEKLSDEEREEFEQLKTQLKPTPIVEIEEIDEEGEEIDIIGRFISVNDIHEFQRDGGELGIVRSAIFADSTGKVQLSFWNDRARTEYQVGDAYKIENARTKLGMYDVDLNIGSGARIIKLSPEQEEEFGIPDLATLESTIYKYRKIDEVDEDDRDTIIIGRIIELYDIREFERNDGSKGLVRNIEIADDTGSIRVVLWDNDADMAMDLGDPIKLQNPSYDINMDNRIEATVSRNTTILDPSESELELLPSYEELKEAIYVEKTIDSLSEDDTNVRVTGTIKEVNAQRIILQKCPNCRASVEETIDEYVCDNCGHTFDEPSYLLMLPTRIEDETGDIQVTFFDKLAEEIIGEEKAEIITNIADGYGYEEKLEDLVGLTVEIIANVGFDEFNEEFRLSPKKILAKYY